MKSSKRYSALHISLKSGSFVWSEKRRGRQAFTANGVSGSIMKYNHVGIPTTANFDGEIPLPHLKVTVSDHQNNPFGIQWQRYWDGAPYPDLVKTVPHVAFEVDDLEDAIRDQKVIIDPNSPRLCACERPAQGHRARI